MSGHGLVGGQSEETAAKVMRGERDPYSGLSREYLIASLESARSLNVDLAAALRLLLDNPNDRAAREVAEQAWGRSLPF